MGLGLVGHTFTEQRRVRGKPKRVQPPQDRDGLVERLAGDESAGTEAHPVATHDALQPGALRGGENGLAERPVNQAQRDTSQASRRDASSGVRSRRGARTADAIGTPFAAMTRFSAA